jgi:mono/diheme cytochrome c family protein
MSIFHRKRKPSSPLPNGGIGSTRLILRTVLATLIAVFCLGTIAAAIVVQVGWYNVGAIVQHWQPIYSLTEYTMKKSVQRHARGIVAPPLSDDMVLRGREIYRANCLECHGAPGISPGDPGKSMQPLPTPPVFLAQRWKPEEMYWVIQSGIKMTGMPAWEYRLREQDIWDIVAYLAALPHEPIAPASSGPTEALSLQVPGNPKRGQIAVTQYACQSCHIIPGVPGSDIHVGPALDQYTDRRYIAGYLPNTPENLALWIRFPRHVKPHSAMPELDVSEADARDMAAYLRTNR